MEEELKNYLDKLVTDCLQSEKFASFNDEQKRIKAIELKQYFQITIFETLIDNLTPQQLRELDKLDFADPSTDTKVAEMSASIPNFGILLQVRLSQKAELIKETGKIPTKIQ